MRLSRKRLTKNRRTGTKTALWNKRQFYVTKTLNYSNRHFSWLVFIHPYLHPMKELYYISRNFTEFGGFSSQEVLDFNRRGLLRSSDFIRLHDTDEWLHLKEWLAKNEAPAKPSVPATPKASVAKKAAAKPKAKKAAKSKE